MTKNINLLFSYLIYTFAGAAAAAAAGYLIGVVIGLAAAFYNNNFIPDASQISYYWWANFFGYFIVCFSVLPGAGIGTLFRLTKLTEKNK